MVADKMTMDSVLFVTAKRLRGGANPKMSNLNSAR